MAATLARQNSLEWFFVDGISLQVKQVTRAWEAEVLCRREVNEVETRDVVVEASVVVLCSCLCARAALCFLVSADCCTKTKERVV